MRAPAQTTPAVTAYARIAVAVAALALAIWLSLGAGQPRSAAAARPARPNVIVILTDDQTVSQLSAEAMPKTLAQLGDRGTSFSSSIVSIAPLLPVARRLSDRRLPAQLRRLRQRAGLRGADRQELDRLLVAAGRRLPDRPRRALPAQLRPRDAARRRLADRRRLRRAPRPRRLVRLRRPLDLLLRRHVLQQRHPGRPGPGEARLHDPGDEPPRARLHPRRPDRPAALLPDARPRRAARRRDHRPRRVRGRRAADPRRRQARQVAQRAAAEAALVRREGPLRQAGLDRDPASHRPHQAPQPEARLALRQRLALDRRRRRRPDRQAAAPPGRPRQHGDLLHLRQRLPVRRAPRRPQQGLSVRGGAARARCSRACRPTCSAAACGAAAAPRRSTRSSASST